MSLDINRLLYESEGVALDFKSHQYRFSGASDVEKSEVLKDIIGFANGFSRGLDSYILIGVEETRTGKNKLLGLSENEHLDDHSLQQFVNSKTNKPIQFSYSVHTHENKTIGLVTIINQEGPFYLKKDFGKLKRNEVYVRRGSSIDISSPASPDEIANMTRNRAEGSTCASVEFIGKTFGEPLGTSIKMSFGKCNIPKISEIPDFPDESPENENFFAVSGLRDPLSLVHNSEYLKELAIYEQIRRFTNPFKLSIKNTGQTALTNTRLEIPIPVNGEMLLLSRDRMPETPKPKKANYSFPEVRASRALGHYEGETEVQTNGITQLLVIHCGNMQPGRTIQSERFFLGSNKEGSNRLNGVIYSSESQQPIKVTLEIVAKVEKSELSINDLYEMPPPYDGVFDI